MAYDQQLAARVRALLIARNGYDEKKMFGGLCFLLHAHMVCGILRDRLIVRVGPQAYAAALASPHAAVFDLTGRPMAGWVQVAPEGLVQNEALAAWVGRGGGLRRLAAAQGRGRAARQTQLNSIRAVPEAIHNRAQ